MAFLWHEMIIIVAGFIDLRYAVVGGWGFSRDWGNFYV